MIASTQGIVLQTIKYNDNACIVHILTRDFGKQAYLVRAPQSRKARTRNFQLQTLSRLGLEVEHLPLRQLQRIKESQMLGIPGMLLDNPIRAALAFFIAELTDKSIDQSEDIDGSVYQLLDSAVDYLGQNNKLNHFVDDFMFQLAGLLGFAPQITDNDFFEHQASTEQRNLLTRYLTNKEMLSRAERRELTDVLVRYFQHQLPGMGALKSWPVLQALFD